MATIPNGSTTWTNTYNADGLRTKRTNGTTTYNYIYNGSSLSQMTVGSNTLYFAYDASGAPMSVTYNGTNYYYATNLQGDVTAILNTSGTAVVKYTYDAWGKILTITGTMADTLGEINPLRYRGYVYDQETQLYYLQSRYYDPSIGRFLNHDVVFDYDAGLQGYNLFVYCGNNPVNRIDVSGADSLQIDDGEQELDDTSQKGSTPSGSLQNIVASITEQLKGCANRANASVSGRGPVAGTQKHTAFRNEVNQLGNPDLRTETSYKNHDLANYGDSGSIRFDVVLVDANGHPIYVWDFKTGSATLTASRIEQMQSRSGFYVPIQVVR